MGGKYREDKGEGLGYVLRPDRDDAVLILGVGVFVGSKGIPCGTFIGIYAGELLTDAVGEERGM